MPPATSQDAFVALMRDYIGPTLRSLGFKGSGAAWTMDDPTHFVTVGFQRSVYGDRTEGRFTVNLTVAARTTWSQATAERPYLPKKPAPNIMYGSHVWQRRLGELMPEGQDAWWTIRPDSDLPALAAEVTGEIQRYAIPAMLSARSGSPPFR